MTKAEMNEIHPDEVVDAYGFLCPMPIIKIAEKMNTMTPGRILQVIASDAAIQNDLPIWCKNSGNELLRLESRDGEFHGFVRKK